MKPLSDGSKSLYLDIYRDGKRTYEYLKMYIIPETDNNARKRNQATMDAANAIKSKRIIELTNGEAGIENREKVFLLDWMNTYKENQAKRGKKDGNQIAVTIRILRLCRRTDDDGSNRQGILPGLPRLSDDGISSQRETCVELYAPHLLPYPERGFERCRSCGDYQSQSVYQNQ